MSSHGSGEAKSVRETVMVFWDYENCPCPMSKKITLLCKEIETKIDSFLSKKLNKITKLYCPMQRLHHRTRSDCTDLGILMMDVASKKKQESVDKRIIADIALFAADLAESGDIGHIVLVSGDSDYGYILSRLRNRSYIGSIILFVNDFTKDTLKSHSDQTFYFFKSNLAKHDNPFSIENQRKLGNHHKSYNNHSNPNNHKSYNHSNRNNRYRNHSNHPNHPNQAYSYEQSQQWQSQQWQYQSYHKTQHLLHSYNSNSTKRGKSKAQNNNNNCNTNGNNNKSEVYRAKDWHNKRSENENNNLLLSPPSPAKATANAPLSDRVVSHEQLEEELKQKNKMKTKNDLNRKNDKNSAVFESKNANIANANDSLSSNAAITNHSKLKKTNESNRNGNVTHETHSNSQHLQPMNGVCNTNGNTKSNKSKSKTKISLSDEFFAKMIAPDPKAMDQLYKSIVPDSLSNNKIDIDDHKQIKTSNKPKRILTKKNAQKSSKKMIKSVTNQKIEKNKENGTQIHVNCDHKSRERSVNQLRYVWDALNYCQHNGNNNPRRSDIYVAMKKLYPQIMIGKKENYSNLCINNCLRHGTIEELIKGRISSLYVLPLVLRYLSDKNAKNHHKNGNLQNHENHSPDGMGGTSSSSNHYMSLGVLAKNLRFRYSQMTSYFNVKYLYNIISVADRIFAMHKDDTKMMKKCENQKSLSQEKLREIRFRIKKSALNLHKNPQFQSNPNKVQFRFNNFPNYHRNAQY